MGGKVERVTENPQRVHKITVDSDCSHEIKRCLLLGRKAMTDLDRVLKNRDHFANKGLYNQSYGFSSNMYGCEGGTIKKAEHQRTDACERWCWRRLVRVPWTARRSNQSVLKERRSNQSILKEINLEYSLKGLMLKLQYFGHLL